MPEGIEQYIKKLAEDAYYDLEKGNIQYANQRVLRILVVIKEKKIKKEYKEIFDLAKQIFKLFKEANFRKAKELLLKIFYKKPRKIVYDSKTQDKIYQHMLDKLKEIFDSDERIREILIYGSCMKKQFGVYAETYKPGTPTARDKTDIDIIFLVEGLVGNEIALKSGYHLKDGR